MNRVYIFVDEMNLYGNLRRLVDDPSVDYAGLGPALTEALDDSHGAFVRLYLYTAYPDQPPKNAGEDRHGSYRNRMRFLNSLFYRNYVQLVTGNLRTKRRSCPKCQQAYLEREQTGVDVRLAVDMVRFAVKNVYDTCILVSADGDLVDACRIVKDEGKHVVLAMPEGTRADQLRRACDRELVLTTEFFARLRTS